MELLSVIALVLSPAVLLLIAGWLARNLIITRLRESVRHEFAADIERLRSDLRQTEEMLRAELRAREDEISALRSGALSAMISRQVAIDQRRLEAIDQLWAAVNQLAKAKHITALMDAVKYTAAAEYTAREPKARQLFELMAGGFDMKKLDLSGAARARPFVTPMVWATFTAYQAVLMIGISKIEILKAGVGPKDFFDEKAGLRMAKAVLPHRADYLDQEGDKQYSPLVEELETKLMEEIQNMLAGKEADRASIERAGEIIKEASKVLDSLQNRDKRSAVEQLEPDLKANK